MIKRVGSIVICMALLACVGDSGEAPTVDRDTLTQRQKDSILSESPLPGAGVVGEALEVSDAAADRAARLDSLMQQ